MQEHTHKHSRRHRSNDIDIFRENNLRAIHKRKQYARKIYVEETINPAHMQLLHARTLQADGLLPGQRRYIRARSAPMLS